MNAPQSAFDDNAAKPLAAHERYTAMYGLWRSLWSRHEEESDLQDAFARIIARWEEQRDVAQLQARSMEFFKEEHSFPRNRRAVVFALFFPESSVEMVGTLTSSGLSAGVDQRYASKLIDYANGRATPQWQEKEAQSFLKITRKPEAVARPAACP